jgi:hypothetical protein
VTVAVSLASDEPSGGQRSDRWWAQVAQEVVDGMRLDGARWLAVRHGVSAAGNDHVHLVVDLTRDDGSRLDMRFYKRRAVRTARALERKHGLEAPAERRERRLREAKQARDAGLRDPLGPRSSYEPSNDDRLRRALLKAAQASRSVQELGDALVRQGVRVRWRTDKSTRQVIGGSIALDGAKPVYRPFGKLHEQLAWPHLSERLAKNAAAPPVREPPAMIPGAALGMRPGQPPTARIARHRGPGIGPPGIER